MVLLLLLSVAYIFAFYLSHMKEINAVLKEASGYYNLLPFFGNVFQTLIALFMSVFILKFLLGTRPFQEAIKRIFQDIFMKHDFLSTADRYMLIKLSKNINKTDNTIEFTDKFKEKTSVEKLEKFFNSGKHTFKDKNYIVVASNYTTTLLSTGVEISNRKIQCKIMNEGKFLFKYRFSPPDKSTDIDRYTKNPPGDRFYDYSYKELLCSSNSNKAHAIRSNFSVVEENDEEWIQIEFSKFRAEKGEIITIEFSISNKFELDTKEDIEEHYKSTYTYPHAVRNITFQLENYKDEKSKITEIVPHMIVGDENAKETYEENIYYKSYSWQINYLDNQNKSVSFKVV